jgi:hypothetical protein
MINLPQIDPWQAAAALQAACHIVLLSYIQVEAGCHNPSWALGLRHALDSTSSCGTTATVIVTHTPSVLHNEFTPSSDQGTPQMI